MADGHIRVGDQERDFAVSRLQEFHVEGRLTIEELEERVDAALKAKTVADLEALFRDLPDGFSRASFLPAQPALPVQRWDESPGSPDSPEPYVGYSERKYGRSKAADAVASAVLVPFFFLGFLTGNWWLFLAMPLCAILIYSFDALRNRNSLPSGVAPRHLTVAERDQVLRLVGEGRRIQAIKYYRELTGADLKTAKFTVDAWGRGLPGA